jgi:hypothetical protein
VQSAWQSQVEGYRCACGFDHSTIIAPFWCYMQGGLTPVWSDPPKPR